MQSRKISKKMKSIATYIILASFFLLAMATALAQQDPNYTFYRYNMNLVNPAYAGAVEGAELGMNIRSQWSGVMGAPETQSLFFSTPVGRDLGLGISVINDKTFIEKQTSIALDVSYHLTLGFDTNLYLGVKVGANSYNANTEGLTTFGIGSDPSLNDIDGGFSPNIGAGAYLKGKDYFVSLSVPRILTPDRLEQDNGAAKLGTDRVHMYLAAGYDLRIGGEVTFKPSAMVRYVDNAPLSVDITAAFSLNERFEIGAAYRLDEGIGGLIILNATPKIDIGYAYESPFESPVTNISNGTHEVFMKLRL